MTAHFNTLRIGRNLGKAFHVPYDDQVEDSLAYFDARVFTIPDPTEVYNYFVWRNRDAAKNSISMVAYTLFSAKELHQKNSDQKQEMLFQKGINWAEYPMGLKNGRLIINEDYLVTNNGITTSRTRWATKDAWVFTRSPEPLKNLIPKYE
jgi:tRNA(His) 5'-end guanylyltransferase